MTDIAFIGRMRSGKDTAGERLTSHHGYTRLAFADPLKEAALALDPWITYEHPADYGISAIRLSELIARVGWDYAKARYPEVRRILQHMGQGVRALDEGFWIGQLVSRWYQVPEGKTVVTDVRYRNEADMLKRYGFKLVRIIRPATPETSVQLSGGGTLDRTVPLANHASERELDSYVPDLLIYNGGSLAELYRRVDALVC